MHRGIGAPPQLPAVADSLVASGPLPRTRRPRARNERALIGGALAGSEADLEALFRAHWPWAGPALPGRAHGRAWSDPRSSCTGAPAPQRLHRRRPAGTAHPPAGTYSDGVLAALAGLSPEQRAVVVMRYVLEYTPGEIAHALELPRGTVNSRLRRGLDVLESRLEKAEPG